MKRGVEAGVLALSLAALAVFFWPVVRDSYPVLDCGNVTGVLSHLKTEFPDLGDRLRAVTLEGEARGHYKPLQDALYQLTYERYGPEGWTFHISALQVLCHLLAALMLHVTVRRMGGSPGVGFCSALLFVLHPAVDESLACAHFGNQLIPTFLALTACALTWPVQRLSWWRHPTAGILVFLAGCANPNWIIAAPLLLGLVVVIGASRPFSWRALLVPLAILAVAAAATGTLRYHVNGTLGSKQEGYVDRGLPESFEEAKNRAATCLTSVVQSTVLLWPSKTTQDGDLAKWEVPPEKTRVEPEIADRRTVGWLVFAAMLAALGARLHGARTGGGASIRLLAFAVSGGIAVAAPYYLLVENLDRNRYIFPLPAFGAVGVAVVLETLAAAFTRSDRGRAALLAFLAAPIVIVFVQIDAASVESMSEGSRTARSAADQLYAVIENDRAVTRTYLLGLPRRFGRAGYTWIHPGHLRGLIGARRRAAGLPPVRGGDYYLTRELASGELTTPLPATHAVFRWRDGRVERLPQDADLSLDGPYGDVLHAEIMERWWIEERDQVPLETSSALEAARVVDTLATHNLLQRWRILAAVAALGEPAPVDGFDVERYAGLAAAPAYAAAVRALDDAGLLSEAHLVRAARNARGSDVLTKAVLHAAASRGTRRRIAAILEERQPGTPGAPPEGIEMVAAMPRHQHPRRGGELTVVCALLNRTTGPCPPASLACIWSRRDAGPTSSDIRRLPGGIPAGRAGRTPIHLRAPWEPGKWTLTLRLAGTAQEVELDVEIEG